MNTFEMLDRHAIDYTMFGSRAIPTSELTNNSDYDYCVLVQDAAAFREMLLNSNWTTQSTKIGQDFNSYRKDEINLIVTESGLFFDATKVANEFAKLMKCKTKQDRIKAYDIIMKPLGFDMLENYHRGNISKHEYIPY